MCVTNTTYSRGEAVSLAPAQSGFSSSMLSQRLMGSFNGGFPPTFSTTTSSSNTGVAAAVAPSVYTQMQHHHPGSAMGQELVSTAPPQKQRPKRRRKPQKPGKTAKQNDRHFVKHDYHDHSADGDLQEEPEGEAAQRRRGGVAIAFPVKLHAVLLQVEQDGLANIVSWQSHGRCFVIHKPKEFVDLVMPKYFRQTKLTSFQRQLNLYGFQRLTRGADAGGYYHEYFLRGKEFLCKKMNRTKVKGTKFKAASSPEQEPDFYTMAPVATVTPHHSSDEEMSFDSHGRGQEYGYPYAAYQHTGMAHVPVQSEPQTYCSYPGPTMGLGSLQPTVSPIATAAATSYAQLLTNPSVLRPMEADRVLDEAVDELFLSDAAAGDADNLAEFVNDWDPSNRFGAVLEDDAQLGFMLDKLLED